ncbi:hypothetical protein F444_22341 [Phytophthora nicotianae P1976]|uniref:Uncharacterized protein n=1 Tax=Phytophthora nicotianae P1976 TaxID=1317066 RepID=A0A080YY27_PHYNI|nr:hypothetical protein F444_22341 [Phytophthora nicotianae P1976]
MKRPPEDALDVSTDRLTCAERWERILEQQEYNEGRLDSGVTDEDLFEAQLSGDSSDSGSASNGDGGDSNEESARCSQELQGITEMMNVSTRVQSGSGAEGDVSSAVTNEPRMASGAKRRDSDSSVSYIATSEREGTTTGREEVQASQKEMHTRASIRVESQVGRGSDDRAGQDLHVGCSSVDDRRKRSFWRTKRGPLRTPS